MGFFSSFVRSVKNIGRGISHAVKAAAKSATKVAKKAWANPLIKAALIAGAMYFSAGTLAPMLMTSTGIGATAAGAITGAATLAVVNGAGAAVSGQNIGKAALKGGIMGAVGGAAAGYFGGAAGATQGGSTGASAAGSSGYGSTINSAQQVADAIGNGTITTQAGSQLGQSIANGTINQAGVSSILNAGGGSSGGLLSQAGNFAINAVKSNPLEFSKLALGAIQGATTPDAIDQINRQQQIDQQNSSYALGLNQVPVDPRGMPLIAPNNPQQSGNPTAPVNLAQVQPGQQFNAQQYAQQY